MTLVLVAIAATIRMDYSDSYEIYNNVLALMAGDISGYQINRFFLSVVLMTPFVWLQERFFGGDFAMYSSRILAPVFYAGTVWFFYRFCSEYLEKRHALWATLLLGLNPLLLRMAVTVKEDLPGLCLAVGAFVCYARSLRTRRVADLLWAGLCIWAASGLRYNQAPIFPPVIALCEIVDVISSRRIDMRRWAWVILLCGVLPAVLFVLGSTVVHYFMGLSSMMEAYEVFVMGFQDYLQRSSGSPEPAMEGAELFIASATAPLVVCAAFGARVYWTQRNRQGVLAGAWLCAAAAIGIWMVSHKEARYFLPALPALYFFVPMGMEWVGRKVSGYFGGDAGPKAAVLAMALILWMPAVELTRALAVYTDPVYTRDVHGELGRLVKDLAGEKGNVYWAGPHFSVYPKNYLYHPKDDYAYIYHIFPHVVEYYSRKRAEILLYEHANKIKDGDVLIVCREPIAYQSHNAPEEVRPLTVGRVRVKDFLPEIVRVEKGAHVFESVGDGLGEGEALVLRTDGTLECLGAELVDGSTIVRAPYYGDDGPDVEKILYLEYERPYQLDARHR